MEFPGRPFASVDSTGFHVDDPVIILLVVDPKIVDSAVPAAVEFVNDNQLKSLGGKSVRESS